MPMAKAGNATDLGKLYFFRSFAPASTDCLVMGHGATGIPAQSFTVPAGITVNFYTAMGEAFTPPNIRQVVQRAHADMVNGRPAVLTTQAPGTQCIDYTITKVLGRHETGKKSFDADRDTTYGEVGEWMQQATRPSAMAPWTPHIAVVRNRSIFKGGSSIKLSDLIASVRAHNATITTFYVAACRVEFVGRVRITR